MQNFILSIFLSGLLLTACSHTSQMQMGDTGSLNGLQAMAASKQRQTRHSVRAMSKIREMALKETALSLGAQAGLAAQAEIIDKALTQQARILDIVYNFNALVLEHNILPPVLLEGRQTLNLADAQTIRISDRTYKVAKQARFITTPPTWRQYLWMDYQKPDYPNLTLLPKTHEERSLWKFYVEKGWQQGLEQAEIILRESIARIKEDYTGMVRYRKLLAMNMVSPPFVSDTDLGVTGDGSEIHIDDRVLRITALPALNTNSQEWRAAVESDEKSLREFEALEKEVNKNQIVIGQGWHQTITGITD